MILNNEIKFLCHFTNINNLENILTFGLLSRTELLKQGIKFEYMDKNRFDNQLNLISFTYNKPNKEMLFYKLKKHKDYIIILIIDKEIIEDNKTNSYFSWKNASSEEIRNILKNKKEYLQTDYAYKKMINSFDKQKEILVEKKVPLNYVKQIVTNNINTFDLVVYLLKKLSINIPVIINKDLFQGRED